MITAVNNQALASSATSSTTARRVERADAEQASATPDSSDTPPSVVVSISAQGARPAGGPPPAGGGSQAASTTGGGAETYEPADANEDGKVSAQEQQAYDARLAAERAAAQGAGSRRTAEADAAVKAYEAVEQLGQASSGR